MIPGVSKHPKRQADACLQSKAPSPEHRWLLQSRVLTPPGSTRGRSHQERALALAFSCFLLQGDDVQCESCLPQALGAIRNSPGADFLPQLVLTLQCRSWERNVEVLLSPLVPPRWDSRNVNVLLQKYFLPGVLAWLCFCGPLVAQNFAFWPQVTALMFPSTGRGFCLVIWRKE